MTERRFARAAAPAGTDTVRLRIEESIAAKQALLEGDHAETTAAIAERIVATLRTDGGKVLLMGNGGSAADATHLAAELVGRFRYDRPSLPALSLTDNVSSISAIGNDYSYDEVFARQVRAFGRAGDVAIGFTTSGSSKNVVAGLRAARELGMTTVAITGAAGGTTADEADIALRLPGGETARVQECTMLLGHVLCELVEAAIFPEYAPGAVTAATA